MPSSTLRASVLLALVACSKAQPAPTPAPSASATVAAGPPNVQSALADCRRIAARGAVKNCQWPDAGIAVRFDLASSGQGSVLVAPTDEGYQRMLAAKALGGFQTASSPRARAFVFWSGGDDATALAIKGTLAELDTR